MNGKDSKNILGNPARFALSAQLSSGARAQTRFEISSTTIAVPTTTFWEPERFSATPGPQWITYSFSEFKSKPASSGYQISLTRDEEAIWNQAATPEGRIDARAAANTTGNLRAIASVKLDDFTTTHHSPPIAFQGVAGQPISRGANCAQADPCPLTDDRYSSGTSSQTCPSASPSPSPSPCGGIEIDLGRPRSISAVFLHGLGISPDATVETSVDGTQWTKRATQRPAAFLAMTWQSPVQARYVWLHAARDGTVFTLTELAVW